MNNVILTTADLMTGEPKTVNLDTPLREVVEMMKIEGIRQLPALDENGRLAGIISDRDVRLAMNSPFVLHERWQDEALLDTATAESCMTPNPLTVSPDTPAAQVAKMLATYKFGALPVVDDGELVGIISVTDFLDWFADQQPTPITITLD
jgi:acetoin utilization protein AcuB